MTSITRAAARAAGALVLLAAVTRPVASQQMPHVPSGERVAGISCDAMEGQRLHIHQHLTIVDHGNQVPIPLNVGRPASGECLYWIHTHTPDGVIHIESPTSRTFTLGDFFKIWGQPLTKTRAASAVAKPGTTLKMWVNGKPYTGDPAAIPLVAHADIVLEAGPPFPPPSTFTSWDGR